MSVTVTGVEQIIRSYGKASSDTAVNIAQGLLQCAKLVLKVSRRYCPRKTGALRASGHVEVEGQGFGAKARVLYGGTEEVYYAAYVHENLWAWHRAPTKAKFLEDAFKETLAQQRAIMERAVLGQTATLQWEPDFPDDDVVRDVKKELNWSSAFRSRKSSPK